MQQDEVPISLEVVEKIFQENKSHIDNGLLDDEIPKQYHAAVKRVLLGILNDFYEWHELRMAEMGKA